MKSVVSEGKTEWRMSARCCVYTLIFILFIFTETVWAEEPVLLWSYKTGGNVRSVAISQDGSYVAAGSRDNKVYFFSVLREIKTFISSAREAISLAESAGLNVERAKSTLAKAEEKLNAGMYGETLQLAEQAYELAIDIDDDGIPNEEDFAPTINNYLIYLATGVSIFASIFTRRKVRAVRKRRQEEYLRKKRRSC